MGGVAWLWSSEIFEKICTWDQKDLKNVKPFGAGNICSTSICRYIWVGQIYYNLRPLVLSLAPSFEIKLKFFGWSMVALV